MEIYGQTGQIISKNNAEISYKLSTDASTQTEKLDPRPAPYQDPFALFAAVIRGKITLKPYDPSSLENNLNVVKILEAARKSAKTGERIPLNTE